MKSVRAAVLIGFVIPVGLISIAYAGPSPPRSSCQTLRRGTQIVQVEWGNAVRTSGCFFFSGPGNLGRDDHLGTRAQWSDDGRQASLVFGRARFEGSPVGSRLRLVRQSTHNFGGVWSVTEVIEGQFETHGECRTFAATYQYSECDTSHRDRCPGQCTIRSSVVVRGR